MKDETKERTQRHKGWLGTHQVENTHVPAITDDF